MRIVLINHYAGSPSYGMEYRPYYLAREWKAAGHEVTILAGNFSHLRKTNPDAALRRETIDGISYCWFPTPVYVGNGLRRFINMLSFVWQLYWHADALAAQLQPDVVIASSTYPLDIVPARRLSRKAKARLVFEVHDLWPLSPMELGGMSRAHPFVRIMRWAEGLALRSADRVVSMLPYAKSYFVSRGMAPGKFCYIPNGFFPAEWDEVAEPLTAAVCSQIRELRAKFPFIVGYAGSHGVANALNYFVEAAAQIRTKGIAFVLVGQGPEKEALVSAAKTQGLDNVLFLDPVSKRQIPALLREFDAAYIGWRALRLYRYGVSPNKIFDYMMAERPIIHGINAESDLVREAKCGLAIPAEDAVAVAWACVEMKQLPAAKRAEMGRNGRGYAVSNHSYKNLAPRFEQAMRIS